MECSSSDLARFFGDDGDCTAAAGAQRFLDLGPARFM
jgi:hypothetical protein